MFLACEQQMSCWPLTQEDTHEGLSHAYSTLGNKVQPIFPPPRGKKSNFCSTSVSLFKKQKSSQTGLITHAARSYLVLSHNEDTLHVKIQGSEHELGDKKAFEARLLRFPRRDYTTSSNHSGGRTDTSTFCSSFVSVRECQKCHRPLAVCDSD